MPPFAVIFFVQRSQVSRQNGSHNWREGPASGVRKALKSAENTIAVLLKNGDGQGGLNLGATLEVQDAPATSGWSHSTFNGLAQIIVQSRREAGEMQLTARADGLAPVGLDIETDPHPDRARPQFRVGNQSTKQIGMNESHDSTGGGLQAAGGIGG